MTPCSAEIRENHISFRKALVIGFRICDDDFEIEQMSEVRNGLCDRRAPDDYELRFWHKRLQINLERTATFARHAVRLDSFPIFTRRIRTYGQKLGLTCLECLLRLSQNDRLHATTADPSDLRTVVLDDRLRPGLRGLRALVRDDCGKNKRLFPCTQLITLILDTAHGPQKGTKGTKKRLTAYACVAQEFPDLRRRDWNVDVTHTEMPECIDHGIDDCSRRADGGRFSDALGPKRVMWRRRARLVSFPVRRFDSRRQQVIHKTTLQDITAFVVLNLLVKRWSKPHRQSTVNLTFDNHRVGNVAAVVDRNEATHFHFACAFIDIDDTDVAAEWIRQIRRIVIIDGFESGFRSGRMIGVSRKRDLLNRLRAIGRSLDEEFARLPVEIFFVRLEQVRCDLTRLVFDLSTRDRTRGCGHGSAATRVRPQTVRRSIRVALFHEHAVDWKPELLGDDLRVSCFVTLAL